MIAARSLTVVALAAALTLAGCAGSDPDPSPTAPELTTEGTIDGVYPDGIADLDVPEGHVVLDSGVPPVAILSADADPTGEDVAPVVAQLLAESMYVASGDQALALELMHGAVVLEIGRDLAAAYDQPLTVAYQATGDQDTWTVTEYVPGTDGLRTTVDLGRSDAQQLIDDASGIAVLLDNLNG